VRDPRGPVHRFATELLRQRGHACGELADHDPTAIRQRHPGGVVAAILQPLQSFHQSRRRVAPTGVPHDAAHQRSGRSGSSSGRPAAASPNRPSWLSLPSSRSVTRSMGSTPPQRAQIRSLKRAADHTLCGELQNRTIRALQARCSHRRHSIEACFSDSRAFVAPQCFKFGARPRRRIGSAPTRHAQTASRLTREHRAGRSTMARPRCTIVSTNDFLSSHRGVRSRSGARAPPGTLLGGNGLRRHGAGARVMQPHPTMLDNAGAGPHPTVLIASHEESSSRSLESILVPNGYTVLKAYTAAQTLERARESRPDAIILDATLRELGAQASRLNAALACVALAPDFGDGAARSELNDGVLEAVVTQLAGALRAAGRASDAIGRLGPTEFAIVASGADAAGAVRLAERLASAVTDGPRDSLGTDLTTKAPFRLRAGYSVVSDARVPSADPADTIPGAASALQLARAQPGGPWIRSFPERPSEAP